jgi:adenine-specific DNA-methyltransferase
MLDEIFGADQFINQVVWKRSDAHSDTGQGAKHFGSVHDMIFLYSKGFPYTWNDVFTPLPETTVEKWYRHVEEGTGRRYNKADITGPGGAIKGNPVYEWKGVTRAWRYSKESMERLEGQGRIVYTKSGMPYQKRYLDESKGVPLQDWWDDISMIRGIQRRGAATYPTEKPIALIERILSVSSHEGDIVLDYFSGAGTTALAAQKIGRRWIGCDINKGAIQTTAKRLHAMMREQAESLADEKQGELVASDDAPPLPAQWSFNTYRVNDYDLQIQHNEAVEFACEHIGVTRTRADGYFDGTLGKRLVKIVPFNHPLTPMDLEDLRKELHRRPEEERDITLVCLGMELTARAWIEDYNRARPINKVHVIELRTDKKYGGFIKHEPLIASVTIKRKKETLAVVVNDVFSPSILQRLNMEQGVFRAQIDDWRAVVDCIMIDTAYDGEVFNVARSDIPARKQDLVEGQYELPAPPKGSMVAVKVIDMLGEEVIVTHKM